MQVMSNAYVTAMQAMTRSVDVFISLGSYMDLTAADDVEEISADGLEMTNTDQLTDAIYEITHGLATFEGYGIKTSVDAGMVAPPLEAVTYPPETALWSDVISDADGDIDWSVTVHLKAPHTSALTLYTQDISVSNAEIVFRLEGEEVLRREMKCYSDRVAYEEQVEYDSFTVHFTRIAQQFMHVRIAEIEFGASIAITKFDLTDKVRVIREYNPMMDSIPLWELDFSTLNVMGDWDYDNPDGRLSTIERGNLVSVAFSAKTSQGQKTIDIGRFVISDLNGTETTLDVTCFDPRNNMSIIFASWSITPEVSFGNTLNDLLGQYYIPHSMDDTLFEMYPDEAFTFPDNMSMLQQFLYLEQYYDIWLIPVRDGTIRVQKGPPFDFYGDMNPDMAYTYPVPSSFTLYNQIQVSYTIGSEQLNYTLDLRKDSSELKNPLTITNPMIMSEEKAIEVANRIRYAMYSTMLEIDWRTDLRNDMGDLMGLYGRYADGKASEYHCIYDEIEYDGSVRATMRCVH